MKKLCFLLTFPIIVTEIIAQAQICKITNVKTVLWMNSDMEKDCWGRSDELLIYTRRIAQDLLPTRIPSDLSLMLQYFDIVWQAASKIPSKLETSKDIVKLATGDVIGGYLQSVGLPLAIEGYYAGNLKFETLQKFSNLFGQIKLYMDTQGDGWSVPCNLTNIVTKVNRISFDDFPDKPDSSACQKLHYSVSERKIAMNPDRPNELTTVTSNDLPFKIAMPLLDDFCNPRALVVPFTERHIFSITSPPSANVLANYYKLAMRCIGKTDKQTMINFNYAFYNWLVNYAIPHLQTFKPCGQGRGLSSGTEGLAGYGGVIQIVETIKANDMVPGEDKRDYGLGNKYGQGWDRTGIFPPGSPGSEKDDCCNTIWSRLNPVRLFHLGGDSSYFLLLVVVPLASCVLIYILYSTCCFPIMHMIMQRNPEYKTAGKNRVMSMYYHIMNSFKRTSDAEDRQKDSGTSLASSSSDQSLDKSQKKKTDGRLRRSRTLLTQQYKKAKNKMQMVRDSVSDTLLRKKKKKKTNE